MINLDKNIVTFHSFRRSGATFAFNHNVSLQKNQAPGRLTVFGCSLLNTLMLALR